MAEVEADVDMTDAPSSSTGLAKSKTSGSSSKAVAADSGTDGKKRFEVKKVPWQLISFYEKPHL